MMNNLKRIVIALCSLGLLLSAQGVYAEAFGLPIMKVVQGPDESVENANGHRHAKLKSISLTPEQRCDYNFITIEKPFK